MLLLSRKLALHYEALRRWLASSVSVASREIILLKFAHSRYDKLYASFQVCRVVIHNHYISFPFFSVYEAVPVVTTGTHNLVNNEINTVQIKTYISPSNKP